MNGKVATLAEAIDRLVHDGEVVYLAGFTHLIPFAAGHEVIRQGKKDLVLCRATPDLIYDQMIAAGCARKVVFSWAGNPGVGLLRAFRRQVEAGKLEIEEYTHIAMTCRLMAGAANLPFFPLRTYPGDLATHNPSFRALTCPFTGQTVWAVPPLQPDVAVVHAQRADRLGNAHIWGIVGEQKEVALASRHLILTVEEIVPEHVIASDPNRTIIPGFLVDAVVEVPWGAYPSYAQGYYDRDNQAYLEWDNISASESSLQAWLEEWVYGVKDRQEFMAKLSAERILKLQPGQAYSAPVDYGVYR